MSKFHSTVSRRDFMKALGLGAAGLGAAGAASPVFHDLDELAASPNGAKPRHPWWVKERDHMDPTTEIDWSMMQRFEAHHLLSAFTHTYPTLHITPEHAHQLYTMGAEHENEGVLQKLPGRDIRAKAIVDIGWLQPFANLAGVEGVFLGPDYWTPEQKGWPKWEGTLEENAATIRAVGMEFGAAKVSFGVIEEGTTKKLINATTTDFGPDMRVEFEDVDKPYVDITGGSSRRPAGKMVVPNNMKYAIILLIRQRLDFNRTAPSAIAASDSSKAYDQIVIMNYRMKAFLKGIGYHGVGGTTFGLTCARPGWATLFGLGELGRIHEFITPEYGPLVRTAVVIPTDLPLPPQNPIDFGANRFCHTCHKCADVCPAQAIYNEPDPDFIITPEDSTGGAIPADHLQPALFNNSPGYKRWPLNHYACDSFWCANSNDCSMCQGSCVFSKHPKASIHEFVKPIIANTSLLDGFFYNMDELFGYGLAPEEKWDDFWTANPEIDFYDMRY